MTVTRLGAGSRLKLAANAWLALAAEAVNASVAIARRLGLEADTIVDALGGNPLVSPRQAAKLQRIAQDDFSAQFALSLALKDVHLATEAEDDGRFVALAALADERQKVVDHIERDQVSPSDGTAASLSAQERDVHLGAAGSRGDPGACPGDRRSDTVVWISSHPTRVSEIGFWAARIRMAGLRSQTSSVGGVTLSPRLAARQPARRRVTSTYSITSSSRAPSRTSFRVMRSDLQVVSAWPQLPPVAISIATTQ
jgi:hypothetical protein